VRLVEPVVEIEEEGAVEAAGTYSIFDRHTGVVADEALHVDHASARRADTVYCVTHVGSRETLIKWAEPLPRTWHTALFSPPVDDSPGALCPADTAAEEVTRTVARLSGVLRPIVVAGICS
jgi:hypothetical protein